MEPQPGSKASVAVATIKGEKTLTEPDRAVAHS